MVGVIFRQYYVQPSSSIAHREDIDEMFNYFKNENKKGIDVMELLKKADHGEPMSGMFNYFSNMKKIDRKETLDKQQVNMLDKNGKFLTMAEMEVKTRQWKSWSKKSNIWKQVISFPAELIEQNVSLQELQEIVIKKGIPTLLKSARMDIDKVDIVGSLHMDKKHHPHMHIAIVEKEPSYQLKGRKKKILVYKRDGRFSKHEKNVFKRQTLMSIQGKGVTRDKRIQINKKYEALINKFKLEEKGSVLLPEEIKFLVGMELIHDLGKAISKLKKGNNGRIKFGSLNAKDPVQKEIIDLTHLVQKTLFNNSIELKEKQKEFLEACANLENVMKELDKQNGSQSEDDSGITTSIQKRLNRFIENAILNSILNESSKILDIDISENQSQKRNIYIAKSLINKESSDGNFTSKIPQSNHFIITQGTWINKKESALITEIDLDKTYSLYDKKGIIVDKLLGEKLYQNYTSIKNVKEMFYSNNSFDFNFQKKAYQKKTYDGFIQKAAFLNYKEKEEMTDMERILEGVCELKDQVGSISSKYKIEKAYHDSIWKAKQAVKEFEHSLGLYI